jgi:hypothetical protein
MAYLQRILNCSLLTWMAISAITAAEAQAKPPQFASKLVGGSNTITIQGKKGDSVTVYMFESSYITETPATVACKDDQALATLLPLQSSGSNAATVNSTPLTGDLKQNITVASRLVPGAQLCLEETPSSGGDSTYSELQTVSDPGDFGRVRADFVAGTVISNQQTSAATSTAAEYLDLGFDFTLARPGGSPRKQYPNPVPQAPNDHRDYKTILPSRPYHVFRPGMEHFINLQLTSVPISTKVTTSTASASSATPSTTSTALNLLTSQQSARIIGGAAFPFRTSRWDKNSNAFFAGPVVKAGFDTLLNPSVGSASGTATGTLQTTSGSFSSVYSHNAVGLRLGWAKFPSDTNQAPKTMAQIDLAAGEFSNLPSYLCKPGKDYGTELTTQPTDTTCFESTSTTTGGTTTTTYKLDAYRTLIPRVQLAGFIQLPTFPFRIGFDANLAQYAVGTHVNKIDPLSKPGNDVRIYFGISIDPVAAIKKLGLPSQ